MLLKTVNSMSDGFNSIIKLRNNNTPVAIAKSERQTLKSSGSSKSSFEEIVLDDDDDTGSIHFDNTIKL